jgi:hypothetical protein
MVAVVGLGVRQRPARTTGQQHDGDREEDGYRRRCASREDPRLMTQEVGGGHARYVG